MTMHQPLIARYVSRLLAPVVAVMLAPVQAQASLTVQDQNTPGVTPTTLAQSLAGAGVTISNITYTGTLESSGQFQGGGSIIGFEEGVILSSGWAVDVIGPNTDDGTSRELGTPGDPDLTGLSGFPPSTRCWSSTFRWGRPPSDSSPEETTSTRILVQRRVRFLRERRELRAGSRHGRRSPSIRSTGNPSALTPEPAQVLNNDSTIRRDHRHPGRRPDGCPPAPRAWTRP
jgi:hypothetical protein